MRLSSRMRDWPALGLLGIATCGDFARANWLSRAARRAFPVIKVRTDRMNHLAVVMDPAEVSYFLIFDEVVVQNVYDLSVVPFVPDTIIDCGAHIGLFTARAASFFPNSRLIAFEPMPSNADMIDAMARCNKLNVELHREAVSDRTGTGRFYQRASFGGSLGAGGEAAAGEFDVSITDLTDFVRKLTTKALLLKMDIEGEEENLIPKLIPCLPERTAIFFETHTAEHGWDIVKNALVDAKFEVSLIRSRDPFRDGFALRRGVVS